MIHINKVVTKNGDKGQTRLATGERVSKASPRIVAMGEIDELNASLGLVITAPSQQSNNDDLLQKITRIQNELFDIGAQLSSTDKTRTPLDKTTIERLENEIKSMNKVLPPLQSFVLPGGIEISARLHLARTICRRAERAIVRLSETEEIDETTVPYFNRLSDWLFVTARYLMRLAGKPERLWQQ